MFPFWKIISICLLFALVNCKKSVVNDFKSITYNLTLTPNFEKSTFDGFLLLRVIPEIDVSTFSLSKGNFNVNVTVSGIKPSNLNLQQKNESLIFKLSRPLLKGKKYVISMYFNNLRIRNDMTGFYKIRISPSE